MAGLRNASILIPKIIDEVHYSKCANSYNLDLTPTSLRLTHGTGYLRQDA